MTTSITLSGAIEGFWLTKRRNLSPHTISDYGLTFRRLCEYIGPDERFDKISGRQINQFLDYLIDEFEIGPKTLLNAWIALSALWTWAVSELGCAHVIRDHVRKPRARPPVITEYTSAEIRSLLDECANYNAYDRQNDRHVVGVRPSHLRDRAIIVVLLDTGLRAQELCDLRIADYDSKRGLLTVRHGKGDKARVVFLGDGARKHLWRYLATRPSPDRASPLFSSREGRHIDPGALRRLVIRLGERCGVQNATLHRFRHTFAVNFLRNGGNLFALQDMLGHASLSMVRRYARLAETDLQDAQRRASVADRWRL